MDLKTIETSKGEARRLYNEYRTALKPKSATVEDEQIMAGYKAIAKGKTILNLAEVMRQAGVDDKGRPHLAISRADQARVQYHSQSFEHSYRPTFSPPGKYSRRFTSLIVVLPDKTLTRSLWNSATSHWDSIQCASPVPIIPPKIRPKNIRDYYILWEAEWEDVPVDPMLLRRIHRTALLYAVIATWDLSALERSILGNREDD